MTWNSNLYPYSSSETNGCNIPTWYSLAWRSKFYHDCLIKLGETVLRQISNINVHILNDDNTSGNQENVAAEVFGPIANGTGTLRIYFNPLVDIIIKCIKFISAPREEILSNSVQFASNSNIVEEVKRAESVLKHDIDSMESLFTLYLSSLYEDGNHAIADHDQKATL